MGGVSLWYGFCWLLVIAGSFAALCEKLLGGSAGPGQGMAIGMAALVASAGLSLAIITWFVERVAGWLA